MDYLVLSEMVVPFNLKKNKKKIKKIRFFIIIYYLYIERKKIKNYVFIPNYVNQNGRR